MRFNRFAATALVVFAYTGPTDGSYKALDVSTGDAPAASQAYLTHLGFTDERQIRELISKDEYDVLSTGDQFSRLDFVAQNIDKLETLPPQWYADVGSSIILQRKIIKYVASHLIERHAREINELQEAFKRRPLEEKHLEEALVNLIGGESIDSRAKVFVDAAVARVMFSISLQGYIESIKDETIMPEADFKEAVESMETSLIITDAFPIGAVDVITKKNVLQGAKSLMAHMLQSPMAGVPKQIQDLYLSAWDVRIDMIKPADKLDEIVASMKTVEDASGLVKVLVDDILLHVKPAYELELVQRWIDRQYPSKALEAEYDEQEKKITKACRILEYSELSGIFKTAYQGYCPNLWDQLKELMPQSGV